MIGGNSQWHWRLRAGALWAAEHVPLLAAGDVLFASSMLNVAELVALRPDVVRGCCGAGCEPGCMLTPVAPRRALQREARVLLYFHENQLEYPRRPAMHGDADPARDFAFGWAQVLSCLAADAVAFNSAWCRDSFLDRIDRHMRTVPDSHQRVLGCAARIRARSRCLPFPLDDVSAHAVDGLLRRTELPEGPAAACAEARRPLVILWNHRWEYDKGPDAFFAALRWLLDKGLRFRVVVMGQRFAEAPPVFEEARRWLEEAGCLLHWGFAPSRRDYVAWLCASDVVVSTAAHEFFGVAVAEAAACGAFPLCPGALSYPEIVPLPRHGDHLYGGDGKMRKALRRMCFDPSPVRAWREAEVPALCAIHAANRKALVDPEATPAGGGGSGDEEPGPEKRRRHGVDGASAQPRTSLELERFTWAGLEAQYRAWFFPDQ